VPLLDQNLQRDLAKEIYGQLTPQQYTTLLEQEKGSLGHEFNGKSQDGEQRKGGEHGKEDHEKDFHGDGIFNKNGNTIREQALSNVVETMLTDLSQGKVS